MEGLASYAATQAQNNTQHYYAGDMSKPKKKKEKGMAKKKCGTKPKKK